MNRRIVVIGSSNTDMVIKSERIPAPGETILGGSFFMNPGGKGANQAVAAARAGGNVQFIAKVGDDVFGSQAIQQFRDVGIDTSTVMVDKNNPSGVALIMVDKHGENSIAVASGANAALLPQDLTDKKDAIEKAAIVLMQLETPLSTIELAASIASSGEARVILNPAPACPLPDSLLKKIHILTPNETEAELLTGVKVDSTEGAISAAKILCEKGVGIVIVTLGEKGALLYQNNVGELLPARKVVAVDTTAAGDVFNGALAVALSEGKEMKTAVVFAMNAASISVTRLGAQASAPYRKEIES